MKKRLICLLLALTLMLSAMPAVSAANHGMVDISGHWAENDIAWVLGMGLFNGTSSATFNPNGTMTRGMFVTVLGRYGGIDPDAFEDWYLPQLYRDVNADTYYAPYINWATRHSITSGTGFGNFSPDLPITREQMAVFLVRFANCYGYVFEPIREDVPAYFDDADFIADYAYEAVELMRECGLITGRLNADGGYDFDPRALATRAECSAVFHRLMSAMVIDEDFFFEEPEDIVVFDDGLYDLLPGDSVSLEYMTIPENPGNDTILWVSSDPSVVSVDQNGTVTCHGSGQAEVWAYTCNGMYDYVTFNVDYYIGYENESYESKCMHVFGEVVEEHRKPYGPDATKADYEANHVNVTVKVWDFKNGIGSEKVTKNKTFFIHKNLVPTVKALFAEIYACEEQYPINTAMSYWPASGFSEHCPGTAIDINPNENPYVDPNGKVITGKNYDPENNPYSIPIDGEVQQIFEKYGFTRGIYWRSGYKDYMHFSFFGT